MNNCFGPAAEYLLSFRCDAPFRVLFAIQQMLSRREHRARREKPQRTQRPQRD